MTGDLIIFALDFHMPTQGGFNSTFLATAARTEFAGKKKRDDGEPQISSWYPG